MNNVYWNWSPLKWSRIGILFTFVFGVLDGQAQLFPGLEGEELVNALRGAYTPAQLLTETQVKDTLYAKVFIEGDSIHCIYSGLGHSLPPGVDPSQWIYENGTGVNSMNLEHSWPQAKGAETGKPGNRNMHHLFPARSAINSDRGDSPYGDIPDASTQKWYRLGIETSTKPSSNIDAYSEFKTGEFEPREGVKGDIARALFYFWTIYRDDAIEADPLFFDLMKDNLCLWHEEDPVDDFEMLRTERIATYQDGKENPFILDCSLVKRAYCPNLQECEMVAVQPAETNPVKLLFDMEESILVITGDPVVEWSVMMVDVTGKKIFESKIESNQKLNVPSLQSGIYFIVATDRSHRLFGKQVFLFP
jgi:endonuclease I